MTDDERVTIGEIGRGMRRVEGELHEARLRWSALEEKIDRYIGPVAVLQKQASDTEVMLKRLDHDVRGARDMAVRVSTAGALLAFVASLIPQSWRG